MRSGQRTANGNSEELLLSIIDDVYSAALDPSLWQGVVRRFVEAVGGETGQLHSNSKQVLESLWAPHGFGEEVMGQYAEYYHQCDEWTLAADAGGLLPCKAVTGEQLVQFGYFKNSEFYNDFLKKFGFERLVCCYVDNGRQGELPKTALCAYRPPGSEPFDGNAIKLIDAVAPHVRRAVQLHWRIHDLDHKNATNVAAFEKLQVGIVLIDEHLRVAYLNPAAHVIVSAKDGLSVVDGELRASLGTEAAQLSRLVGEAGHITVSASGSRTGRMIVSRKGGGVPYGLSVVSAPMHGAFPVGRQRTAAIVLISAAFSDRQSASELVAGLYSLTTVEKRFLRRLLEGAPLKRAAFELGISSNTAHSHLSNIFRKTGTHRQADLVRLAMSLGGPLQS